MLAQGLNLLINPYWDCKEVNMVEYLYDVVKAVTGEDINICAALGL